MDYVAFTRGTPSRLATAHPQRQRGAGDVLVHAAGPADELSVEPTAARQHRLPCGARTLLLQSSGIEYWRPNTSAPVTEEWTRKVHGATVGMYHRIQKSCMDMMKRYQRALLVVGETVGVIVQDPAQLLRFSLQRRQQRRRMQQSAKTQRPPGRGQAWARRAG